MNNTELKSLCERVGTRLTGKPCLVRFQEPAWKGAKGTACKRNRTAVIDILPGLNSVEFLHVLLHELGHVKTLWTSWTVKVPEYAPGSLSIPAAFKTSGTVSLAEQAANQLAEQWLDYADRHADKHEGTWLTKRLKALERYFAPEIERAIDAGVEMALAKVRKNFEGVK